MLQLSLHDPEQLLAQAPDAHPVPQEDVHPVPQLPVQLVLHAAVEQPDPQEAVEQVFLQLVLQPCLQLDEHIIQPALLFISTTTCLTSL